MGPNMPGVNVAVIVGSNRRDSINRKLARALVRTDERLMREHGKQVAVLTDPDMAAFVRAASRN